MRASLMAENVFSTETSATKSVGRTDSSGSTASGSLNPAQSLVFIPDTKMLSSSDAKATAKREAGLFTIKLVDFGTSVGLKEAQQQAGNQASASLLTITELDFAG